MRLPSDTERHAIVGTTGSGKTVFGLWCLSHRNFDEKPWIIIDFKGEPHIAEIPGTEEIAIDEDLPDDPGLYIMRPTVADRYNGAVTAYLFEIHRKGNTGVFIDEGYMIPPRDHGLTALLTQGRSKHIPMICLSQRPAFISPFLLSEAEFKSIFFLENPSDIDRVNEWMPACEPRGLPDHHSFYYQREGREFHQLSPCEPMETIIERFRARLVGEPPKEYLDVWGRRVTSKPWV